MDFPLGAPAVTRRKIHFAVPAGVAPPLQPIYKVITFLRRRFTVSKETYTYVPASLCV